MMGGGGSIRLVAGGRQLLFPGPPALMGILNRNTDSFADAGHPDLEEAVSAASAMAAAGAAIVDVGAESARTNRGPISEEEEIARLLPLLRAWGRVSDGAGGRPILSVNTWRPAVVRAALGAGAEIINDIGGLVSDENARLCAAHGAALVIMHTVGEPKVPHRHVRYRDVIAEIGAFFEERLARAARAGLPEDRVLLDPGIDFAKSGEDNLAILRGAGAFLQFGRPLLMPISRKSVIGATLGLPDPAERDPGTVACLVAGMLAGAHIFRVHNVPAMAWAARATDALLRPGAIPG